jgi:hypothetical protein
MIRRRPPAQIAERRCGVGNAEELGDAVLDEALNRLSACLIPFVI